MTLFFRFMIGIHCAYLDPNVGGWLFQLIFPVLVAIGGFGMVLRRRILGLWSRFFGPIEVKSAQRHRKTSPTERVSPPGGQPGASKDHPERHRDFTPGDE
ncbi:MAG TPA: hypothetical protein VL200_15230 [Lacunisphaera sp.]|jgi:hypothetical protein|nr:hypothetical protein [Lacunisphaera sp.]